MHSAHNWRGHDRPPSGRFSKASNSSYPVRNNKDEVLITVYTALTELNRSTFYTHDIMQDLYSLGSKLSLTV